MPSLSPHPGPTPACPGVCVQPALAAPKDPTQCTCMQLWVGCVSARFCGLVGDRFPQQSPRLGRVFMIIYSRMPTLVRGELKAWRVDRTYPSHMVQQQSSCTVPELQVCPCHATPRPQSHTLPSPGGSPCCPGCWSCLGRCLGVPSPHTLIQSAVLAC